MDIISHHPKYSYIAAMQWQTGNESVTRGFQFEYTPLGFLDWADYTQSGLPYAYDVYYYYDKNGNMTKDLNKRISSIQYNLLNLPQNITFSTGSTIAYTYDAAGRKLNVTYGTPAKTIEYCGNMIYEDGTLTQILTEGGYVTFSGSTPVHHAYLKDHQGNNRVVINSSGTIEQVNHYYPFGYFFGESTNSSTQRYKYNGKEFDEMHGLHWYDYGARHYDPAIMRFTTMDPMCEKYYHLSPYAYCGNNPVKYIDSYGEEPTTYEAALMAKHVYGDNVKLVGGWHLSDTQFASFNTNSGLKSALYERTNNHITEYAYVTAGTQDVKDIWEDAAQLIGQGEQYKQSIMNANMLKGLLKDSELTFVGHSLGGGLAAANALVTDRNAITFNSAAITTTTKEKLKIPLKTNTGRIFNVVVEGEIVNYLQSKLGLKLEGGKFVLKANYLPEIPIFKGINSALRIANHSIDNVIYGIDKENGR